MNKMRVIIASAMLVLCIGAMPLLGCSQATEKPNEQSQAEEESPEPQKPAWDIAIGGEAEPGFIMTNDSGKEIIGVSIKDSAAAEYPANMLMDGVVWGKGDVALICYPADDTTPTKSATESDADEPVFRQTYDIQLTAKDGSLFELHQVVVGTSMEDATLSYDAQSNLAYLAFSEDGVKVTTLEAEKAVKANAEAAAAAAAEAEAAAAAEAEAQAAAAAEAEAQAAAAAEAEAQRAEAGRNEGSGSNNSNYDDTSSGSSGDVGQSGDVCIDDPIFR